MEGIEMNTFEGKCKYCGEIQPIMAMDQIDADEKISEKCSCGGAEMDRKEAALLENLKNTIGKGAPENGFTSVDPKQEDLITNMALAVLHGNLRQVTCKIKGATISITRTTGTVKVKRTDTKNMQLEA